jgi:SAM-dependent methyltransferase
LAPGGGDRFLDLACGTGGVALIAARKGTDVTGIDISADQLDKARAAAAEAGLSIRFDEGDVQQLPYEDASFDVLASAFGLIFAPSDERTVAGAHTGLPACRPAGDHGVAAGRVVRPCRRARARASTRRRCAGVGA